MEKTKKRPPNIEGHKHGRVPKALREKQILDVAEELFIQLGYNETTVEAVRLAAGVSRPIIYDHYGSKDKLYIACVKRARAEYEEQLMGLWNDCKTPQERITRGTELYYSVIESNPKRWLVLFSGSSIPQFGELGEELAKLRQTTIDLMVNSIASYRPDVERKGAEAYANAIFAVGEQLGRWWLKNPQLPKAKVLEYHVSFISAALGVAPPV